MTVQDKRQTASLAYMPDGSELVRQLNAKGVRFDAA